MYIGSLFNIILSLFKYSDKISLVIFAIFLDISSSFIQDSFNVVVVQDINFLIIHLISFHFAYHSIHWFNHNSFSFSSIIEVFQSKNFSRWLSNVTSSFDKKLYSFHLYIHLVNLTFHSFAKSYIFFSDHDSKSFTFNSKLSHVKEFFKVILFSNVVLENSDCNFFILSFNLSLVSINTSLS